MVGRIVYALKDIHVSVGREYISARAYAIRSYIISRGHCWSGDQLPVMGMVFNNQQATFRDRKLIYPDREGQ